jgi:hypothetical protein
MDGTTYWAAKDVCIDRRTRRERQVTQCRPASSLYSLTDAARLSTRLITWRRTAKLGILAIALTIATPSFEDAYRENGVLFIDPVWLSPIKSITPHCSAWAS